MSGAWARGSVKIGGQPAGVNAAEMLMASKKASPKANTTTSSTSSTTGGGSAPAGTVAVGGKQLFDYYLIMDFEATCEDGKKLTDQEIIEMPAVLVDAKSLSVVSEFQRYIKPVRRPMLSTFCTNLTGIQQSQVEGANTFPHVLEEFLEWLGKGNLGTHSTQHQSFAVVTCGDWDLKTMYPMQHRLVVDQVAYLQEKGYPLFFKRWINLKQVLQKNASVLTNGKSKNGPKGMDDMLKWFGLPFIGRHHSGIDDCRNIAACTIETVKRIGPIDFTWTRDSGNDSAHFVKGTQSPIPPRDVIDASPKPAWDGNMSSTVPSSSATTDGEAAGRKKGKKTSTTTAPSAGFGPYLVLDQTRGDVAASILAAAKPEDRSVASKLSDSERTSLSKKVSSLLRHKALEEGLPMTSNGFVPVDTLLNHRQFGRKVNVCFLAEIVANNDKQRFMMGYGEQDGNLYIRANQGHSIEGVNIDMKNITDPADVPVAVHGTYYDAWKIIQTEGLNKMGRQHIHFAKGLPGDTGVISGMRKTCQVLVYIDVPALLADGIPLLMSENGVLLSPGKDGIIAPKYFYEVKDVKTGKKLN